MERLYGTSRSDGTVILLSWAHRIRSSEMKVSRKTQQQQQQSHEQQWKWSCIPRRQTKHLTKSANVSTHQTAEICFFLIIAYIIICWLCHCLRRWLAGLQVHIDTVIVAVDATAATAAIVLVFENVGHLNQFNRVSVSHAGGHQVPKGEN